MNKECMFQQDNDAKHGQGNSKLVPANQLTWIQIYGEL